VFGADHVYRMDPRQMLAQHIEHGAGVTVAGIKVPRADASSFGVITPSGDGIRVERFLEKPADPPGIPGNPEFALASMGIYVFETRLLIDQLRRDAADPDSEHDFGKNLIPWLVRHGKAVAHRFENSCVRSSPAAEAYWRDVGTVDAYWSANLDLASTIPALDLYDRNWPIWTYAEITPPAKFVHDRPERRGQAVSSLVSGGCIISGASLRRSLLFTGVRINSYSSVENAVIMPYVNVGRGARLRNVVIDRGVEIPEGLVVGEDPKFDAKRFRTTENGISLITQPMIDRLNT
jgi:glucose-1-phosphate adenylyltransferase